MGVVTMTNTFDSNDSYVTIEDVREAHAAFIRIKTQVWQIGEEIDRNPHDDENWKAWWRAHDEQWKAGREVAVMAFRHWKRTGVDFFQTEVI
jgi:hypothetical protein